MSYTLKEVLKVGGVRDSLSIYVILFVKTWICGAVSVEFLSDFVEFGKLIDLLVFSLNRQGSFADQELRSAI